jgi:hypothetical protein
LPESNSEGEEKDREEREREREKYFLNIRQKLSSTALYTR